MLTALLWGALFGAGVITGAGTFALRAQRIDSQDVPVSFKLNDPQFTAFLANRIRAVKSTNPDGTITQFDLGDDTAPNCNLTINGEEPLVIPDDDGCTTLVLVEVSGKKAKIGYMSKFRRLDNHVLTVDCGIVEIAIRKKGFEKTDGR